MKKAYLIHGWEGHPENSWFPWLRQELKNHGYKVVIPSMPDAENPRIEPWVNKLKEIVEIGPETILIGHSIGCQAILRFLQTQEQKIAGVFFVAGFVHLNHLETEEEKEIAQPWLTIEIDWAKVKGLTRKFVAIFSDNDPDVDITDSKIFEEKLDAKIIIEHDKGHFDDDANITELPSLVKKIKSI